MYPLSHYSWQLRVAQRKTVQRKDNRTIKTTVSYHFTPVKTAIRKSLQKQMLVRIQRKENPCTLMVGTQIGVALWKQYAGSSKNKNRATIWSTPGYISRKKKKENINSNRYMHPNVHSHLLKSYNCLHVALTPKGEFGIFVSRMVLLAKRVLM